MATPSWESLPEGSTLHACGKRGLELLAASWRVMVYPANSRLVTIDDEDTDVFFVLNGQVRAEFADEDGRVIRYDDLGPGEAVGLFAALDGLPRSANVHVLTQTALLARLPAPRFVDVLYTERAVTEAFMVYLVARVRTLSERLVHLSTRSARQRLAMALVQQARPETTDANAGLIEPAPYHHDLAAFINVERETVTRGLTALQKKGLIEKNSSWMRLPDLAALRRIARGGE